MKVFAPNRKNSSCQEMVGQYLRRCSMGNLVLDTGYWVLGTGYWVLGTGYWVLDTGYWILDAGRKRGTLCSSAGC